MKFSLDYSPPASPVQISHRNKLMLIGSCFAEHIGDELARHKFEVLINPSGIIFNPLSICETITNALQGNELPDHLFVEHDGKHFSYAHHGSVAANSRAELKKVIAWINRTTKEYILSSEFLFISLGTAFVYRLADSRQVVANCHKQPGSRFDKALIDVAEITKTFEDIFNRLYEIRPQLQIVLSVSPVKYLRDGLVNNNRSKATLLLAAHRLAEKYPQVHYFPAYELVTDDLRDYRFYKEDLAHPNNQAIQYVWEKFGATFFSDQTREIVHELHKLNLSLQHRPIHGDPAAMARLQASIEKQQARIQQLDPGIRF